MIKGRFYNKYNHEPYEILILNLMAELNPDLVVTDIKMPVMDGVELTKVIKKIYPWIQVVILSSYDDFQYVRETLRMGAFDYILKPKMDIDILLDVLKKAASAITLNTPDKQSLNKQSAYKQHEKFLKNLLCSRENSPLEIAEELVKHKTALSNRILRLFAMVFHFKTADKDDDLWKSAVMKSIEKILGDNDCGGTFFYNDTLLVGILNDHETNSEYLKNLGTLIIKTLNQQLLVNSWLIFGDPCSDVNNLIQAWGKLLTKTTCCFYYEINQVLWEKEIPNMSITVNYNLSELNPAIEELDFNTLQQNIDLLLDTQCSKEAFIDPYVLKNLLVEICYFIIHKITEIGYFSEEINRKKFDYFKDIENAGSYKELAGLFNQILDEIHDYTTKLYKEKYCSQILEAIEYINCHYSQNISLSMVANQVHLDKSYFSKLFKEDTGQNFSDYLEMMRLNKAKELLRNPNYNVNIVCSMVGYSDCSYFGKVFKKIVGKTPSEYSKIFFH